ncbi:unnamed protein product [Urochloa decumbens]|uniref:Uncharacterized protein n=1 Tax=Urochloa decumbens TaxID=240449 RepID=A0ABC8YNC5_9POAL
MADDGDAASSTGSNDVVVSADEIRCLFPEVAGPSVQKFPGPNPEALIVMALGVENGRATLNALLKGGRWLEAADHVARCLQLIRKDEQEGPADVMLREHPELIVLLRRQHALEMLGEGKPEQAQGYYLSSISGTVNAWLTNRTLHLDALVTDLGDTIAAAAAAAATLPLDLPAERRRTCRDVRDYLRVYFPEFDRGAEASASMARSRSVLCHAAPFGEVVGEKEYRCLVCHKSLTFPYVPDQHLTEHLHYHCPAMTPAVRSRLPRANRPPGHAAAEAKRRRYK